MNAKARPAAVLCVGHAVQDFVFTVPEFPTRAEKHRALGFTSVGGGPAATAAVTIAALDGRALLAALLGADQVASVIEAELRSLGVDVQFLQCFQGCTSSVSSVLVDARGERLIVNYTDPALPSASDWLPDPAGLGVAAVLADSRWPEGALAALQAARRAGIPAVLDADRPVPADPGVFEAASHLAFSHEALSDYTGIDDPVRALSSLSTTAWCCVTVGAAGVYVRADAGPLHIPAPQVPVVDTLGAGDVWHGAFALALAEGADALHAVRFANAAAAVKVQRPGGRRGVPRRAEVAALQAREGV